MRRDLPVLALYPVALLVLTAVHVLAPQRAGILALSQILAPHLFLLAILLVPFAFDRAAARLQVVLVLVLLVAAVRFGPEWVSIPPPDEVVGTPIEVLTWNLERGSDAGRDLVDVLAATRADVVVLQELTPDHVALIEAADALGSRFPHRVLQPGDDLLGVGLLTVFPIVTGEPLLSPAGLIAELDIGGPLPLVVISAHPLPPRYQTAAPLPLPIGFQPARRDDDLGLLHERAAEVLAADRQLVLLGDFNVAPTEPAYTELAAGLLDVHAEVGQGPGWTWRPHQVEAIPAGVLRIDYVFTAGDVRPIGSSTDCSHPGDHCILAARVVVSPRSASGEG